MPTETLGAIAREIGVEVPPEVEDRVIEGVRTLGEAGPAHVSFFTNETYLDDFRETGAAAVLVEPGTERPADGPVLLEHETPSDALRQILEMFHDVAPPTGRGVQEGALVDPSAEIGDDVTVFGGAWVGPGAVLERAVVVHPGAHVGSGVRVGEETVVGPNVVLHERVEVGARCRLNGGCVIGASGFGFATVEPGVHRKIPQVGGVRIEDDVEIGANSTVDAGTVSPTVVGRGTKIDNLVMIAHNCRIGEGGIIVGQVGVSGSARVGDRVTMAGQVGVVGHVDLGDDLTIGAQSGVTRDHEGEQAILGSPAMPIGKARRVYATWMAMPERYRKLRRRVRELEERLEGRDDQDDDDGFD